LSAVTGINREIPIVASVQAALSFQPTVLAIGLAPSGGALPEPHLYSLSSFFVPSPFCAPNPCPCHQSLRLKTD
ncbi:MAG: hypothetical protein F6K42_10535, partial [Leptolyngbya sp. SIO1D8]|nr:hypothetical protein [Leptolyngbya sp. SIO1D8]